MVVRVVCRGVWNQDSSGMLTSRGCAAALTVPCCRLCLPSVALPAAADHRRTHITDLIVVVLQLEEDFVKANPEWVKELEIMVSTKVRGCGRGEGCVCVRGDYEWERRRQAARGWLPVRRRAGWYGCSFGSPALVQGGPLSALCYRVYRIGSGIPASHASLLSPPRSPSARSRPRSRR